MTDKFLCQFDMDCVIHTSEITVCVRRLKKEEIKKIGVCQHPDCMKLAEYEVVL